MVQPIVRSATSPGSPEPLGADPAGGGVNFAVFSRHAEQMWLVLFDAAGLRTLEVIPMARTGDVHHVRVEGAASGLLYGYRASGPWDPGQGHRFNDSKLLMDPYGRAFTGRPHDREGLLCGHDHRRDDRVADGRDSAPIAPRSMVVDSTFDWQGDSPPRHALEDLVIYEVHVKGFTAHPSSGVEHPGTYAGFREKIPHLVGLGVNAVELLPVMQACGRPLLEAGGLSDYWGYNTVGFFAPESSYRGGPPGSEVTELKTLVRELHRCGIEVILDVAYNHTGEGDHTGPSVCFRGIDNRSYYRLQGHGGEPLRYYRDETGALNTLALEQPHVQRLILDSMRYWAGEMHVDGFRIDLAPLHALRDGEMDPDSPLLRAVEEDPVLREVKLIAEPWGPGLYHLGRFPARWAEWNDRFRDTVRSFLRGEKGQVRELGWRLTGSADILAGTATGGGRRSPGHSVNFVTCHDGFTLADLWSYNRKHNEANGEGNRDGNDHNRSWNCGVEGETRDPQIVALRRRMARNAVCCLLFSLGAPMLLGGDEMLRTQGGNNNAYCQDNPGSWFDWGLADRNADFVRFVREAIALRRRWPVLRRRRHFDGGDGEIAWHGARGGAPDWHDARQRALACEIDAGASGGRGYLYLALNAGEEAHTADLPAHQGLAWHRVVDTSLPAGCEILEAGREEALEPGDRCTIQGRSVVVLAALPAPRAPAGSTPPPT